MALSRRALLRAAAAVPASSLPGLVRADAQATLQICRDIQALAFEEIPYYPIGQYKQPTAYRKDITGILDGTAVFWNVRPS